MKYRKILLISKTPKFNRIDHKNTLKHLKNVLSLISPIQAHLENTEFFCKGLLEAGFQVEVVPDINVKPEDQAQHDLCISMGGDGTFITAAHMIKNNQIPLLGINSDPATSAGHLCQAAIHKDTMMKDIDFIIDCLLHETTEEFFRTRISTKIVKEDDGSTQEFNTLNDICMTERNIGKASSYILKVDDTNHGKIKSSGILLSTGTGSTGWLYNARKANIGYIEDIMLELGFDASTVSKHVRRTVNDFIFKTNDMRMYYYNREMWADPRKRLQLRDPAIEGFCSTMELKSMCLEGTVVIDGNVAAVMKTGDKIEAKTVAEKQLKCLRTPENRDYF